MTGQELCIACAADEKFAIGLAVTLFSAISNSKSPRVRVFVIDGGVSGTTKARLSRTLEQCEADVSLSWIDPGSERMVGLKVSRELSVATYFRVFLPRLLPDEIGKVIYLDCDLVIEGDLCDLWGIQMAECSLLAVQDFWYPKVSRLPGEIQTAFRTLDVLPSESYFNAGVLVIDLEQWRTERVETRVCEFFAMGHYRHDQDGLNAVLAKRWKALDLEWNVQQVFGATNVSGIADDAGALPERARIVHYSHHLKPWHRLFRHEGAARFHRYLKRSGWFGRSGYVRWSLLVILPQVLALAAARMLRLARRIGRRQSLQASTDSDE